MFPLDHIYTSTNLTLDVARFATRAFRFMDAYWKGLNGQQAAWAGKQYRGHRVVPTTILDDLARASL